MGRVRCILSQGHGNSQHWEERGMYLGLGYRCANCSGRSQNLGINQMGRSASPAQAASLPHYSQTWMTLVGSMVLTCSEVMCQFENLIKVQESCPRKVCKYIWLCMLLREVYISPKVCAADLLGYTDLNIMSPFPVGKEIKNLEVSHTPGKGSKRCHSPLFAVTSGHSLVPKLRLPFSVSGLCFY